MLQSNFSKDASVASSLPVAVNPLEVCDCFSLLWCKAPLMIISQWRPQAWGTHRVVCVFRAPAQDLCLCLSSLSWWRWKTGLPPEDRDASHFLFLLYFDGHMLKPHEWLRCWACWGIPECAETGRMGNGILLLPSSCKYVFWRYPHSLLGIWLVKHEFMLYQSRESTIPGVCKPDCLVAAWL